jgi:hypothetical protein
MSEKDHPYFVVFCHLGNCSCVTLLPASMQLQHHDIAYMDEGANDLSGTKIMTVHPDMVVLCHPWHHDIPFILTLSFSAIHGITTYRSS